MRGPGNLSGPFFMGILVTVSALIRTFSMWERIPIDIEDHVKPEFLKLGVTDEIWFWADPKLNPGIVRGQIQHWDWPETPSPNAKKVRVADITYAEQLPHEWQRLVCCKEMLHILDPMETRVTKPEDIESLIQKIILPADLQDPFSDGIHALTDRIAITYAAAVLFPLAARDLLVGKMPLPKIAELLEIPLRYAALIMSDGWPDVHKLLIK
jgi:hypothetical protein